MSYGINMPVPYVALPATPGYNTSDHSVSWTFDGGTSGAGLSVSKTWLTVGNHTATATATNNITGAIGTAQKTISLVDWTALTWVYTANSMLPTGSTVAFTNSMQLSTYGKYLINCGDYYHPEILVIMDTQANTVAQYSDATIGAMSCAYALTTGPNAGKLLVLGVTSGKYAFVDPATGIFTIGSAALPFAHPTLNGNLTSLPAMMGNGLIYYPIYGYNGFIYQNQCMTYDPINDVWVSAAAWPGTPLMNGLEGNRAYALPSGKLFLVIGNSPYGYIVDGVAQTVSVGPASTHLLAAGMSPMPAIAQLPNKKMIGMKIGAGYSVIGTFTEGDADWVWGATASPTINNNLFNNPIVTPDGFVAFVARAIGDAPSTTIFYNPPSDSWVKGAALPFSNIAGHIGFAGGRFWRCTSNNNLYYMVWP